MDAALRITDHPGDLIVGASDAEGRRILSRQPIIGYALASGGARGSGITGAMKVLEQAGIRPSVIAGTSIGSLVGAAHATGLSVERVEQEWLETDVGRVLRGFLPSNPRAGLSSGNELRKYLVELLGERSIEDLEIPYAALACDVDTGEAVTLTSGSLPDAVRASCAIPGVFHPVRWSERILVDGGLVEPLPVRTCRELGAEYVIAIDICPRPHPTTTQVRDLWSRIGEQMRSLSEQSWVPASLGDLLARLGEESENHVRPLPGVYSVLNQSIAILQQELLRQKMVLHPPDVVIRPDVRMSIMGYFQAAEGITAGEAAAEAALPEILEKLGHP